MVMKDGSASNENIKLKTVMADNTTKSCTIGTTFQSKLKLLNTEMTKPEANTNSCHGLGEAQRMWPSYIMLKVSRPSPLNSSSNTEIKIKPVILKVFFRMGPWPLQTNFNGPCYHMNGPL